MTSASTINWRDIGPTTAEVYEAEFRRVNSPLVPFAKDMHTVAGNDSALALAHMWMENKYSTTGHIIKEHHNNPMALRPGPGIEVEHGFINVSDGSRFLSFKTPVDCVREWRRRIHDPSYKVEQFRGGAYTSTTTLTEYLGRYAPSGDVHPVTGLDNADINYEGTVRTMLKRYESLEKTMSDVVVSPGKGDVDIKPTEFAPLRTLAYLENAPEHRIVVRDGPNVFFRVRANVRAIRPTARFQRATSGAAHVGPIMEEGDEAFIEWAWIERNGSLWLYSDWGTRFYGTDFERVDGKPIVPGDTDPDTVPTIPDHPPPVIITPPTGPITAENYKNVEDPATLLPPLIWRGSPNFFPGRSGIRPVSIMYHITDDNNLSNVLGWFQNPNSQASSHFVIARDGTVYQMVSSKDGAWTNGDVNKPRTDIKWIGEALAKRHNLNNYTITYEFIGTPSNPPTEAQYVAAIKLSRYFCHPKVYGINTNRSHQNRHADVNSVSRSYCPGPHFQLERIIRALGGDPTRVS